MKLTVTALAFLDSYLAGGWVGLAFLLIAAAILLCPGSVRS